MFISLLLHSGPVLSLFLELGRCLSSSTASTLDVWGHPRLLLDAYLLIQSYVLETIIAVHEGPPLYALCLSWILCRDILKYLLLLLLRAIK